LQRDVVVQRCLRGVSSTRWGAIGSRGQPEYDAAIGS
jgi:hypothetical protein